VQDEILEVYYAKARLYDPNIQRFLAVDPHWHAGNRIYGRNPNNIPDPLAIGQSQNLYVYALNNPLIYVDHNGEFILTTLIVGGLVAAGTNIITQVGSDRIAGESFSDSVSNISWGEFVIHGVGGVATTFIPGSNVLLHAGAHAIINTGIYSGTQFVNSEPITASGLLWSGGTGAVFGGGMQMINNHMLPPTRPALEFGVPYRLTTFGISNANLNQFGRQVGTWFVDELLKFTVDEYFKTFEACPFRND
jgi:RHS repeat-associated protein